MSKFSYGIILFRQITELEVLLVQRRYTYAFCDFVYGRYSNVEAAKKLFNKMTPTELLHIYNLDFRSMCNIIWTDPAPAMYAGFLAKFTNNFITYDGGIGLKRFIDSSYPSGRLIWEVPKGRKSGHKEPDLICAIRELQEETGYSKGSYTLLPNVSKIVSYLNDGNLYVNKFYIALLNQSHFEIENATIKFCALKSYEIADQRWFKMHELEGLNKKPFLLTLIKPAKKLIKKHIKGKFTLSLAANVESTFAATTPSV